MKFKTFSVVKIYGNDRRQRLEDFTHIKIGTTRKIEYKEIFINKNYI